LLPLVRSPPHCQLFFNTSDLTRADESAFGTRQPAYHNVLPPLRTWVSRLGANYGPSLVDPEATSKPEGGKPTGHCWVFFSYFFLSWYVTTIVTPRYLAVHIDITQTSTAITRDVITYALWSPELRFRTTCILPSGNAGQICNWYSETRYRNPPLGAA